MNNPLDEALQMLTAIQRQAVDWESGALLVLAGPGSGKTQVLTCRIARLLSSSPDQRFRVLALTFTNKAANEMAARVAALAPTMVARATIGTFHAFCTQVLRQHGVHLGIKPDFAIFSLAKDRQAILDDALRRDGTLDWSRRSLRLLPVIDGLKARLVEPDAAEAHVDAMNGVAAGDAGDVAHAYCLYENELRRANALDFNSLILDTYRLFAFPAIARQYQRVYRHWLIDEFQDTNSAQYALLRRMAGEEFRNLVSVADDDQTIFEWNGANVRRIVDLVRDFSCDVVQLPVNFRCPPHIVEAANRLVVYNTRRVTSKRPAVSVAGGSSTLSAQQIPCLEFATDSEEAAGVADEIAGLDAVARSETAVLARSRSLLEAMHKALITKRVSAMIVMRRDEFSSAQMRWLVACLKQIGRPLDRHNMVALVDAFNGFGGSTVDWDDVVSRSESHEVTCLEAWLEMVREVELPGSVASVVRQVADLARAKVKLPVAIERIIGCFREGGFKDDLLNDDLSAWRRIQREIKDSPGGASLDRFLQELELRSKEPVPTPGTVSLTTIHGAKGQQFDNVYLIGLADEVLPSWQSLKKGTGSAALEEERRGCFVAVTRTKKRLILSRAGRYGGWPKRPSRFLEEMGIQ